jgi:hypothetical protein
MPLTQVDDLTRVRNKRRGELQNREVFRKVVLLNSIMIMSLYIRAYLDFKTCGVDSFHLKKSRRSNGIRASVN